MHAVFTTFRSTLSMAELKDDYRQFAERLRDGAAPGFISKTWLSDGQTIAGFYLFEDRPAADAYLDGMFAAVTKGNPTVSDMRIERFEVNQALSEMTNGLGAIAVSGRS